ncbi:MAG: thioredoxin family protein [Alphaproteobacteria bacterium]|jgi:thioredoxin-related protein|nr:thioredoxin family protein [Alphaproteobacteria bacterium]
MLYRVLITVMLALFGLTAISGATSAAEKKLPAIEANEEGLYVQPWFLNSFLDLREDIKESAEAGKQLVIIWEQRGCPYCREMHRVNLRIPAIVDYIKANYNVIQLNLWGDREVTDVDGEVTTEKKLARKYRVQFTPTLQFFPQGLPEDSKTPGHEAEVWRLMGYWKPFHFHYTFVYVREKGYVSEPNFQRWLQKKAEKLRAEGKEVKLW